MTVHGFSPAHVRSLLQARAVGVPPAAESQDLAATLYSHWYAAPLAESRVDPAWPPLEGMLRLAQGEALGWTPAIVIGHGAGGITVARAADGRARALLRGSYTHQEGSERTGLPAQAGEHIMAVPRSGGVVSEGWWRSWGGGWDPRSAPKDVTRVYLGPALWELPYLVGLLTVALETRSEPWMIKVLAQEHSLGRPDAMVIYVASTAAFGDIVECARGRVRTRPGPPLTEILAPGVSWAQEPGDGCSFGESRCSLMAGILQRTTNADDETFLGTASEEFLSAGLDPTAPHLRRRAHE
ncbi:T3SS effector HopA1 family protein [Arthrobacter sp. N199823]|uniref:T3SS effector HopA1 family protein n=1 Tax=Arthrobacter sp. N199823 TaxID=2058895 RepID=UPI0011B061F2|nr:T3SS effector HopA1 family protein [Arthrobacter sp. N199823]